MAEFSNLLRQRLTARADAQVRTDEVRADLHPDPDTLTAFVEQVLPVQERGSVLRHLAVCRDCRDIVALSQPDLAASETVVAASARATRRWRFLWSPRVGMAASLAAVAIVTMVVLQVRNKTFEQAKVPGNTAPATASDSAGKANSSPTPPSIARAETLMQPSAEPAANSKPSAEKNKDILAARAASSVVAEGYLKTAPKITTSSAVVAVMARNAPPPPARYDYVNPAFFANNASPDQLSATVVVNELPVAPAPRTQNQTFQLGANLQNSMPFASPPTQSEGTQIVRSISPPSSGSRFGATLSILGPKAKKILTARATPPILPGSLSFSAMGGSGQLNPKTRSAEPMAAASDKSGNDLDSSDAFSAGAIRDRGVAMRRESAGPQSFWRVAGGKVLKSSDAVNWSEGYPSSEGIEFGALSVHGQDIWAGGNNAALLHSHDGGETWERITLGASANGTINRIDVRGTLVQAKSSSGQSWSSRDAGKTWTLDE